MSLAGLFLITFLLVHLGINLLLVFTENNMAFNKAAHFMGTNIFIKVFEVVLFGGFFLHIIYALILQFQNWRARPKRYYKANKSETSPFSKWMIHTAAIILLFLVVHLIDFYIKAKFIGDVADVVYDGKHYHDLATLVVEKFQMLGYVIFYIISFLILGFHLTHGFQSAFKTLGLNNKTYTPIINVISIAYTVLVVAGFTLIPLLIYFR